LFFIFVRFFCLDFCLLRTNTTAQTIGYRQTNLASDLPNVANNITPGLVNPWGIAFLSDQPFFISDNRVGRVTAHDATGLGVVPGSCIVPNAAWTGFDTPTGIVADQNSFFGSPSLIKAFILVTEEGTISTWGPDAQGDLPQAETLVRSRSADVYKGVAILDSLLTAPALAVTDLLKHQYCAPERGVSMDVEPLYVCRNTEWILPSHRQWAIQLGWFVTRRS
jgi:hypothetical protein